MGTPTPFSVDIGASNRTVDEWLSNPTKSATEVQLQGRRAADFVSAADDPDCNYAIAYPAGTAVIAVTPSGTSFLRDRSCVVAQMLAQDLVPTLP